MGEARGDRDKRRIAELLGRGHNTSMARLQRWRGGKWAGLGISLIVAAVAARSLAGSWRYDGEYFGVALSDGCICVTSQSELQQAERDPHAIQVVSAENRNLLSLLVVQLTPVSRLVPSVVSGCLVVPLWIPLSLVVIPTAFLFWCDRRRVSARCCQACGYDLTGNTSGVCPECGVKVEGGSCS